MTAARRSRVPVAILGATGAVGQTFVRLLAEHPWFEITALMASERSAGRSYGDAVRWIEGELPDALARMPVGTCEPGRSVPAIAFSALDSGVAGAVEQAFARAGSVVVSNAKNHRMDEDVPLLIPEINPDHLALLDAQRRTRGWPGAIVTNPNCAAVVAAMALAPLHQRFGVRDVVLATMQAVSGAGYPGVASLDILGNAIPYIREEEDKLEREPAKILGSLDGGRVTPAAFRVSAHANRVAVEHGHTVCLSVRFEQSATAEQARAALREWRGAESARGLPSAPERALELHEAPDRPQPRRDVGRGAGMTVSVGRVREDPLFDVRLVALGHNTIRGAAGAAILNAELMVAGGLIASS